MGTYIILLSHMEATKLQVGSTVVLSNDNGHTSFRIGHIANN